jgi:hypothetical protein
MKKWVIIGMLAISLVAALLLGGLHFWTSLNESMSQDYLSGAITMAFYFEPWQGGAGQLSADRIGAIASKLDYDKYGVAMRRNPEGFPLDVWGRPFRIHAAPAEDEVGVYVLEVRSAGPDGAMGTEDDVVRKEHIPVVFYVFRDHGDPAAAYDFALIGTRIVARKVTGGNRDQVVFYEYCNVTGPLAKEAERWKVEPGKDVTAAMRDMALFTRADIPADETQAVQETCFPKQGQEYKEFLARLRKEYVQDSRRADGLPLFVVRDARLARFLRDGRQAAAAPIAGPSAPHQ